MKNKDKHKIDWKYKKINFVLEFEVKHPPKQYKYEIHPSIENIKVFHNGEDIRAIVAGDMSMELITYLYDNYSILPIKKEK